MTAYEVIQQHPEWVENPTTPRKQITEAARRYVRELDGGKHFNALIIDDVERLLKNRGLLKKQIEIHEDLLKESTIIFNDTDDHAVNNDDYIVSGTDGHEVEIKALETAPDYIAAERKVKIYAIFIKAIIAELNGKAICTTAQIQEWRERYGVKLEGLQAQPEKVKGTVRELKPIADLKAEKVFIKLKNWGYIDCNEDVFLWHFGERKNRVGKPAPDKVKWNGDTISIFSLVGDGICEFAGHKRAEWNLLRQHFSIDWTNAQLTQGKQDALDNQEREEIAPIAEALEAIRKADEEERIKRREEAAKQRAVKDFLEDYMK